MTIAVLIAGALLQFLLPILPIWLLPLATTFIIVKIVNQNSLMTGFKYGIFFGILFGLFVYVGTLILPPSNPLIGGEINQDVIVGMIAFVPIDGFIGLISGFLAKKIFKLNS